MAKKKVSKKAPVPELKTPKIKCLYDELVDPKKLKANPENPNGHGQDQIELLAKSLKHYGVFKPIIVSNQSGYINTGHGTVLGAIRAGYDLVPVQYQDFENADVEYGQMCMDNGSQQWSSLDLAKVNARVPDFDPEFDLDMLGIRDFKLDAFEKNEEKTDEDHVPEPPKKPKSKLGDIFILGDHRLMCGDSTNELSVAALMDGQKADITFTSPPYNLGNNAKLRGYNGDGDETVYNEKTDHKSQKEYLDFMCSWTNEALKYSTTVFCNVQLLAGNKLALPKYWMHFHDKLIDLMIWDKEHAAPQMAERVINSVFEFIFIFTNEHEPKRSIKTGPVFRGTLQNIFRLNPVRGGKDEFQKTHGAVFPVAFAEHFAEHFSDKSVLDLFGGSGTTMIACEKTGRKNYSMELDPSYCDIIISRWESFTGKTAVRLEQDGSTTPFNEI